jgi:hypothetical protein
MLKLIFLNNILLLGIAFLAVLLIHLSRLGILGPRLHFYCTTNSIMEYFVLIIIFIVVLSYVIHLIYVCMIYLGTKIPMDIITIADNNNNNPQDPVIW